jgi:putative spermidine/putrescine transport system ATP-binding protein
MLKLLEIKKKYGEKVILDSINLTVNKGEIFTLLGPSGTGKSTLLKIIVGIVPMSNGTILLNDKNISDTPIQHRNVGMVFQDYSLFPSMSVKENVAFPLVARQVKGVFSGVKWLFNYKTSKAIYYKVDEMLDLLHIKEHSSKRPDELSGGEQQRVALARSLVFEPDLLCLDEPFSALDKNLRQNLQQELVNLQQHTKKTFLFVTHDQSEAFTISSRLGVLHNGSIKQIGKPEDVYYRPESVFVAKFLGDCNIFPIRTKDNLTHSPFVETESGIKIFTDKISPPNLNIVGIRPEKLKVVKTRLTKTFHFSSGKLYQLHFWVRRYELKLY